MAETETGDADRDDGLGGDEPFCEHGNLLWSETCDECIDAGWKLTDEITAALNPSHLQKETQ